MFALSFLFIGTYWVYLGYDYFRKLWALRA
jgi:hypothetical protein